MNDAKITDSKIQHTHAQQVNKTNGWAQAWQMNAFRKKFLDEYAVRVAQHEPELISSKWGKGKNLMNDFIGTDVVVF